MKYALYLCGDEEPTETFTTKQDLMARLQELSSDDYRWMDRRWEEVPS